MSVVLLVAVIVILVAVFFVATGRGGGLASEHADYPPLDLGPVTAADVAMMRPPTALWGYNMQVTDEALDRIAGAMRDRDIMIAYLRRQLADLDPGTHPAARPSPAPAAERQPGPGLAPERQPGPGSIAEPDSGPGLAPEAEPGPSAAAGSGDAPTDPPASPAGTDPGSLAADEQSW